jgi:hypothetical protein
MLIEFEHTNIFPALGPKEFAWPDWEQSTKQMLTRLVAMRQSIMSNRTKETPSHAIIA